MKARASGQSAMTVIFRNRTVTAVIQAEGDGLWVEYAGGYSDMLSQKTEPSEGKL